MWHNEIAPVGEFPMPLKHGEVQGYDFNRMVVEFTMLNQSKVIFLRGQRRGYGQS